MPLLLAVVAGLVAIVVSRNARHAARQYLANRQLVLLATYLGFLVGFGWTALHLTYRLGDFILTARDIDVAESTPYVGRRLREPRRPRQALRTGL